MIYIVYECDTHRTWSSVVIKFLSQRKDMANKAYNKLKKEYMDDDWYMNLAVFDPNLGELDAGNNAVAMSELLRTTE